MEFSNPTAIPNPVWICLEVPEAIPTMMLLFLLPCLLFLFSLSLTFPFLPFPSPSHLPMGVYATLSCIFYFLVSPWSWGPGPEHTSQKMLDRQGCHSKSRSGGDLGWAVTSSRKHHLVWTTEIPLTPVFSSSEGKLLMADDPAGPLPTKDTLRLFLRLNISSRRECAVIFQEDFF